MAARPNDVLNDEHDVDFGDYRAFAVRRWSDVVDGIKENLTTADRMKVMEPRDWSKLHTDIIERTTDRSRPTKTKAFLNYLILLPRSLGALVNNFVVLMQPERIDYTILWGLVELNTTLSIASVEKSARALLWTKKLRTSIEIFVKCLETCEEEDKSEARLKIIEVLEATLGILGESIDHLRNFTDSDGVQEWNVVEKTINDYISEIATAGKHLKEITSLSKVNQALRVRELTYRYTPVVAPAENASFPLLFINARGQNEQFFGRMNELKKIDVALGNKNNNSLQTYTIYGRRGVGKTDIALEYAYTNQSKFDAIFWVRCEISITIRQSYNDMAVELCLPGADRHGHHEENQLAVLQWLKITAKRWLLIFDNAEREEVLKGYWPIGAKGSILITSRGYYNFLNDAVRKGVTVKPFNEEESWDLLIRFLGPEWIKKDVIGLIAASEKCAGKALLVELRGLALAIEIAAQAIKNPAVGGDGTIERTYMLFLEKKRVLPPNSAMPRCGTVESLDALWSITFARLSRNAHSLLGVLALLSPDGILIDLFLPRNQSVLNGRLSFCLQPSNDTSAPALAFSTQPRQLTEAVHELVKYRLVARDSRELFCHRVVQEAMNFNGAEDLQECFDTAVGLVYEAFPKQVNGDYLTSQWAACERFISHGAQLSRQFSHYQKGGRKTLAGTQKFSALLTNCARFLYQTSDYDLCLSLTKSAVSSCDDKSSVEYANICGIAGSAYYELNKLILCRQEWEVFKRIQEDVFRDNDLERSGSYHNMGNLEYASENFTEAMQYLNLAIELRTKAGEKATNLLASSYLCIARVYYVRGDYKIAFQKLSIAEDLFVKTVGPQAHFMAYVHYAYGNLEFDQHNWIQTKRSYEQGLKIALATSPIHPITIALYYSLGCVDFARNGFRFSEGAITWLDKGLTIAELRCPKRDDGVITRILWKKSVVLRSQTTGLYQVEANELLIRAEQARGLLNSSGEGRTFTSDERDEGFVFVGDEEEHSYDALVPGFFR